MSLPRFARPVSRPRGAALLRRRGLVAAPSPTARACDPRSDVAHRRRRRAPPGRHWGAPTWRRRRRVDLGRGVGGQPSARPRPLRVGGPQRARLRRAVDRDRSGRGRRRRDGASAELTGGGAPPGRPHEEKTTLGASFCLMTRPTTTTTTTHDDPRPRPSVARRVEARRSGSVSGGRSAAARPPSSPPCAARFAASCDRGRDQRHLHEEDAEALRRLRRPPGRTDLAVATGCCPHTAIRDDITANLDAVEALEARFPDLELLLIESGGDNLTATFSYGLIDRQIFVIDVAGGDKVPRKGGPGVHALGPPRDQQDRPGTARRRRPRGDGPRRGAGPARRASRRLPVAADGGGNDRHTVLGRGGHRTPAPSGGGRGRRRRAPRGGIAAPSCRTDPPQLTPPPQAPAAAPSAHGPGCTGLLDVAVSGAPGNRRRYRRLEAPGPRGTPTPTGLYLVGAGAQPIGGDELKVRLELDAGAELEVRSAAATLARRGETGARSDHRGPRSRSADERRRSVGCPSRGCAAAGASHLSRPGCVLSLDQSASPGA